MMCLMLLKGPYILLFDGPDLRERITEGMLARAISDSPLSNMKTGLKVLDNLEFGDVMTL